MLSSKFSIVPLLSSPEQTKGKRWLNKTQWQCLLHRLFHGAAVVVMVAVMITPEKGFVCFDSSSIFPQLQALL